MRTNRFRGREFQVVVQFRFQIVVESNRTAALRLNSHSVAFSFLLRFLYVQVRRSEREKREVLFSCVVVNINRFEVVVANSDAFL